jgi:hypothetical protein
MTPIPDYRRRNTDAQDEDSETDPVLRELESDNTGFIRKYLELAKKALDDSESEEEPATPAA